MGVQSDQTSPLFVAIKFYIVCRILKSLLKMIRDFSVSLHSYIFSFHKEDGKKERWREQTKTIIKIFNNMNI